jgi:hypothetical protein
MFISTRIFQQHSEFSEACVKRIVNPEGVQGLGTCYHTRLCHLVSPSTDIYIHAYGKHVDIQRVTSTYTTPTCRIGESLPVPRMQSRMPHDPPSSGLCVEQDARNPRSYSSLVQRSCGRRETVTSVGVCTVVYESHP